MACFLLFGAFMDEFSQFSGRDFKSVDIATPEVLVGGLIGSMIIFLFTGLAISAVGRTAHEVRCVQLMRSTLQMIMCAYSDF